MRVCHALAFAVTLCVARDAAALSGFYVGESSAPLYSRATQVALMREGTRTVVSMQSDYEGPAESFALVVPVPIGLQKEDVKTLPRELFARLEQLDAPRLVEYWEQDPCATRVASEGSAVRIGPLHRPDAGAGAGGRTRGDLGVAVEAQFVAGEYEITVLGAADSSGLDAWLRAEKYQVPEGAEVYLRPYVQGGFKFVVARVDAAKLKFEHGAAVLSPLRFSYDSDSFTLPVRLGLLNTDDSQDLIVHVLAKGQRYELANYPNVAIPTNLDLVESAKGDLASAYNALFDATLADHKGAVVTEYSWDASTCDPCPGPALTYADIATLGGDAMPAPPPPLNPGNPGNAPARRSSHGGGYVLTRLHVRYERDALAGDLVFRPAPPILGGREIRTAGGDTSLEQDAQPSSFNNFQARYAVRHAWTGPIACEHPTRGIWGGPPAGQAAAPTRAATQLAFSERGELSSFVGWRRAGDAPPDASSTPAPASTNTPAAAATSAGSRAGGCGSCATGDGSRGGLSGLAALIIVALSRRRLVMLWPSARRTGQ